MKNIKIQIKGKEPSGDSILARKNFPAVINEYHIIRSSYAKITTIWGSAIGLAVLSALTFNSLQESEKVEQMTSLYTHQELPPISKDHQPLKSSEKNLKILLTKTERSHDAANTSTSINQVKPAQLLTTYQTEGDKE